MKRFIYYLALLIRCTATTIAAALIIAILCFDVYAATHFNKDIPPSVFAFVKPSLQVSVLAVVMLIFMIVSWAFEKKDEIR